MKFLLIRLAIAAAAMAILAVILGITTLVADFALRKPARLEWPFPVLEVMIALGTVLVLSLPFGAYRLGRRLVSAPNEKGRDARGP